MESIKYLSEDAYEYLDNIPSAHWSRHSFITNCKSNMLLNNLCETFNAVIKDARDKPILTQMEWLRKYMMARNNDKWEGVQKYEGRNMPYVKKIFDGYETELRNCTINISRRDIYEVEHRSDQCVVHLAQRTCTCYQWDLTGIPCIHAFRAILHQRGDPDEYVHAFYSRAAYCRAYEPAINPMPGSNHWDKTKLPEPLPPKPRTMPGRPKSHKRRKEKGEDDDRKLKRLKKTIHCGKCGAPGHNKSKCQNLTGPKQAKPKGRSTVDNSWTNDQRAKKKARVIRKVNKLLNALYCIIILPCVILN